MDKNVKKIIDIKISNTVKNLQKHDFETYVVKNGDEARQLIKDMIPERSKVNVGGSQTLFEIGMIDELRKMDITFYDRYVEGVDVMETFRLGMSGDYFLTSSNAITEDGYLYNIDGAGGRVASMIFGPKNVVVVAGYNKIVKDMDAARNRLVEIAAPMNNERLNTENPCTKTGVCIDCNSERRICSYFVETRQSRPKNRIKIIIIEEEYGY